MIIKKYKNRKYYCIGKRKFVDQKFIIGVIKRKDEFIIINSKNEDITNKIILKLLRKELRENDKQKSKEKII